MTHLEQSEGAPASLVPMVLIVAMAAFMQMLDASILVTAIPQMARDFGQDPLALGIGITAYVMATAILLPISGWLADRCGARRVFVAALLAFTAASVLCGLSRTLPEFAAARVLQGLGGAVLGPVSGLILMRTIPRGDLIRMMNIFSAPMLIAPVLGPPVGGFITTMLGWPWVFYLNVPVGLAGALLALRFLPVQARQRRPFDLAGFMLNGFALGAVILGFGAFADRSLDRMSATIVLLAGLAAGGLAIRHARRTRHPLLPITAVRHPSFALTSMVFLPLTRLPVNALPFTLPIMLQVGLGMTAFASGALFLTHTLADLLTKLLTGCIFRRLGYRIALIMATIGFALSVAACAAFVRPGGLWLIAVALVICGFFRSVLMTGIGTLSYADIPPEEMASATTLNQVMMQISQALAVSLTIVIIDVLVAARGGAGGAAYDDYRLALALIAGIGLLALWPLARLAPGAGSELSGHRPTPLAISD